MLLVTDIYDIFANIRKTAMDLTGAFSSVGVALASIFACFYLLTIAARMMSGKKNYTFYEVIRPFIIILLISFIRPVIGLTDSFISSFTTPIRESTNVVVDSLTTRVSQTVQIIEDFELEEGRGYRNADVRNYLQSADMLRDIFREEGVPEQLAVLTLVESDFHGKAKSSVGAGGWYQFMPETARGMGLRVDDEVDERENLTKSAHASARYLKGLYDTFGSWPLALAAYNAGGGTVQKAQEKAALSGQAPEQVSFTQAYQYLPKETRGYIPNFISASKAADKMADKKGGNNGYSSQEDYLSFVEGWGMDASEIRRAITSHFWPAMIGYLSGYYAVALTLKAGWSILVAFFNWLADNVYLIIDAWAELTLILLIFLAPFIFAFSVLPNYKNGIQGFFARYLQVSMWKIIGGAVAWASASARLGFYNIKLAGDLQADSVTAMNEAGWFANGGLTLGTGLATIFLMFQVPTIAGYIISSSGGNGLINNLTRMARKALAAPQNKMMNDASTAINTRIDLNRLKRYRKVHAANQAVIAAGGTVSTFNKKREQHLENRLTPAANAIWNKFRLPQLQENALEARLLAAEAEKQFMAGEISEARYNRICARADNAKQKLLSFESKMDTPQTLTKKVSKHLKQYKLETKEIEETLLEQYKDGQISKSEFHLRLKDANKQLKQKYSKWIDRSHL